MKKLLLYFMLAVFCMPCLFYNEIVAQENKSGNKSETLQKTSAIKEKKKPKKKNPFDLKYNVGIFYGTYIQGLKKDFLIDTGVRGRYKLAQHYFDLSFGYKRNPFFIKTFNFDDNSENRNVRIIQKTNDILSGIAWLSKWHRSFRSEILFTGSYRDAEVNSDNRWNLRLLPSISYGNLLGWQASLNGFGEIEKYPNYLMGGRKLDQYTLSVTPTGGYRWKHFQFETGYTFSKNQYEDARYDAVKNGIIERASTSKSHLKHIVKVSTETKPTKKIHLAAAYSFEINDSRNYSLNVQGRDQNMIFDYKFIEDYYDYNKHRVNLGINWKLTDRFSVSANGVFWERSFSKYEARSADNVWLGESRKDMFWEAKVVCTQRIFRIHGDGKKKPTSDLNIILSFSHEQQISNMQREVSYVTNYKATQIFAGIEATGL